MFKPYNTNILGFHSFSDWLITTFGLKFYKLTFTSSLIASLTGIIETYIYNDAKAVYFMLTLIMLDLITGTWKAIKQKNFKSSRLPRIFVTVLCYCLMLSMGWNAAKYSYLFSWLPGLIYGGLVSTLLLSVFENLTIIGILPENVLEAIKKKLS